MKQIDKLKDKEIWEYHFRNKINEIIEVINLLIKE